ncbi:hypothetical protein [Enterococcus avium]|uniref:hypothetical protein n=1 Tax=Enterococcus avium TaxID=33945 RepID=UPI002E13B9A2
MQLSEVQTIFYLLHAIQFNINQNDRIDFNLIVPHNGKLLTADFLPISIPFSLKVKEISLDIDGDESKEDLEKNFFSEVFKTWKKTHDGIFFNHQKAFAQPGWLLQELINFLDTFENIPQYITSRVTNLKYIESNVNFNEALLDTNGYSIISLVIK